MYSDYVLCLDTRTCNYKILEALSRHIFAVYDMTWVQTVLTTCAAFQITDPILEGMSRACVHITLFSERQHLYSTGLNLERECASVAAKKKH